MRVRLNTVLPLPPYKAWYVLPSAVTDDASSTVLDIKRALCSDVLSESSPEQVALFIDGFEILDETSIEVLQPGDLITAKQKAASIAVAGTKRKDREDEEKGTPKKKAKIGIPNLLVPPKPPKPPARASSSSDSSDSSSSESSSTSDTSSSSDSDSDSDSDSSSSSASGRPQRPSKPHYLKSIGGPLSGYDAPLANRTARVDVQSPSFVPPGQGKPSTQARNARRRRRQQALKGTQTSGNASSAAEASPERLLHVPEGTPALPVQVTATMVRNKGKRKQFLASSSSGPERIVFNADTDVEPQQAEQPQPRRQLPRLIPPSERADLPPNLFVTSVDVEADLWARRKRKAKRVEFAYDESVSYAADAEVSMPDSEPAPSVLAPAPDLDIKWPALAQLAVPPSVGTMLAWKALDINPATLSPEVMVHTGCVLAADLASGSVKLGVTKADVAFGATRAEDMLQDEEPEEVEMALADILGNDDWRLLA